MKPDLYYPVKPAFVNQAFGVSPNVATNAIYIQQGLKGHPGIDFKATHGQPIYAAHDGTCYPTIDDHGGNGIVLQADPVLKSFFTIYWHLIKDDAVVHTGQVVKAGDLLGYADSTGVSTGDHLHFGLSIYPLDVNNGFEGHIDPTSYFNGKFAQDLHATTPYTFKAVLRLKAWSNDVKQLQTLLKELNLYTGAIDGIFGARTEKAVVQFQAAHGLVGDGIVGPKTNAVLNTLL